MNTLWSLAGHDPFGAAGLSADARVGRALGVTLRPLITTFTAQNAQRIALAEPLPEAWIEAQWRLLREAESPGAIKLGFMPHPQTLARVGRLLAELPTVPVVCDPVLTVSSAADQDWDPALRSAYREYIAPRVTLFTPNLPEAERLLGRPLQNQSDIVEAAAELRSWGIQAVLIKGGHAEDLRDYCDTGEKPFCLAGRRQPGSFRGTGCTLSSAIASGLARGLPLREAITLGHSYVQAAIAQAAAEDSPILPPLKGRPQASPLSYDGFFAEAAFAPSEAERLSFYPIVPSLELLTKLLPTGIKSIQLRLKDQPEDVLKRDIAKAAALCRAAAVDLYVNDYWELALAAGAFGVHLGQEDLDSLSPAALKRLQASGLRLGLSTHSFEEAARAVALRPSYIALGPIFPTTCKSMRFGPQGVDRLQDWRSFCPEQPLVAIGGLKLEHVKAVREAGADGIAVVSAVTEHPDPPAAVKAWLAATRV